MTLPTLTDLELDVLRGLYNSQYHDGGERPWVWSWSIAAEKATPKQIPGVVSSLSKKGLTSSDGSGEERTVYVTDLGVQVARALGIYVE